MKRFTLLLFFVFVPNLSYGQREHPLFFAGMELRPPPSLEGTRASLTWQNFKLLDLEGLKLIKDDQDLLSKIDSGQLVKIVWSSCLVPDSRLDTKWHYVLPQVKKLLEDLSMEVCLDFGSPIRVNSAVRHSERQLELIKSGNLNAAPVDGTRSSTHLTGASVDLSVVKIQPKVVKWLTEKLLNLEKKALLDATLEEKAQNVLHVTVFREYIN